MVTELAKGTLSGAAWFEANEMCEGGWKSLVAIFSAKGRVRSVLMGAATARPVGTARAPF